MLPPALPRLHFIGVCGKAMGGIAGALSQAGWRVSGSDENPYPPMSEHLERCGVRILAPYHPGNVPADVDRVIVGKRVAAGNPELLHVIQQGMTHRSFPQFLHDHFLGKSRNAVVAGGLGKTTTTAMLAWILECNGLSPDYLIGGLARNFDAPARFSGSSFAVLEGDEYASCFDDRNPKFLHYRPEVTVITNIIEDHPDIYRSFDDLCDAFAALIETIPVGGCLIVPDNDKPAAKLALGARCRVVVAGFGSSATEPITDVRLEMDRSCFRLMGEAFEIGLCGRMNVGNAAMAAIAAAQFGVAPAQSAAALRLFQGVRNRQEEVEIGNCTLVRDKATHPRALGELIRALRQRFPGRRLVSVIQPRATGGRDWIYQRELPMALCDFDKVILASATEHNPPQGRPWENNPFCLDMLARAVAAKSADVTLSRATAEVRDALVEHVRDRDVIVVTAQEQSASLIATIEQTLLVRETGGGNGPAQSPESQRRNFARRDRPLRR
jgi:UDP-N-acetylmuramate: L-alanyl-gamma-D-glutamyl-meso-diaminopimelate ligase